MGSCLTYVMTKIVCKTYIQLCVYIIVCVQERKRDCNYVKAQYLLTHVFHQNIFCSVGILHTWDFIQADLERAKGFLKTSRSKQ
jgi:hypothetical protein